MKRKLTALLLLTVAHVAAVAQQTCSMPVPPLRVKRPDIFSDEQEQWLGDVQADMIEPRYTLLPPAESKYLDQIGQRLLEQLPPSSIQYTFRVFESPDLRAFSLAGGRVYISRKLIMDARNEDELAAMLAQEIGRIYIHHSASLVTRRLDRILHVKSVGDRADVYDKFERALNMPSDTFAVLSDSEQEDDELLADRVGLYTMIKAQYDPNAFATFLDRVNDNGGFTGNLFTDVFDMTPLISMRVRMANKLTSSLPAECKATRPIYHGGFKPFQDGIQRQRINPIVAATPGLNSTALTQPVNPALENVVISQDGNYLLAQDAYQIHVLTTSPLELRFSVDALGAEMAQFTPDSQRLVFNYNDLHVEQWELASGQPTDLHDYVDYAGCMQTSLSPDGNDVACISQFGDSIWLKLADIHSGEMLYQNLHFFDETAILGNANVRMTPAFQALMHWSRDGRYFVATSGTSALAYDLKNRATIHLGGALSNLAQERFTFVGSEKMVSTCDWSLKAGGSTDTYTMCYSTFPAGQTLKKFQLPAGWMASVAGGASILFGPMAKASAVLVDPATALVHGEFRGETLDVRGDEWAAEMPDGGVGFAKLDGNLTRATLPITPLNAIEASAFSSNGRYVAFSDRARGAEWDLSAGKRMAVTEPFRDVAIDDGGKLQVDFVPHELNPSNTPGIDRLVHKYVSGLSPLGDPMQFGSVRIQIKPLNTQHLLDRGVELDANDVDTEARLWSRAFPGILPKLVDADGDKTLLVVGRAGWTGNAKLIHTSDLPSQFINPIGLVVEVVSNRTGKTEDALFGPQLPVLNRPTDDRTADLFGDVVAIHGNNNDTTVYRVSDGTRLLAFFGRALAGDDSLGMIVGTNRLQELNIYDTAHAKRLAHYFLDQGVIAARFVPESKQLLVLTAAQSVYRIDLSKLSSGN